MSTSSTYEIYVLDRMYERRRYIQLLTILFPHVAIASKNIHDIANRIASQFFGFVVPFVLFIYFSTSKICFAEDTAHINSSIGAKCYSIAWIRFDIHFCGTLFHHLVSHSVSFFLFYRIFAVWPQNIVQWFMRIPNTTFFAAKHFTLNFSRNLFAEQIF